MKNPRWIGGIILMIAAAVIFLFNLSGDLTPVTIVLLILGISLAATARRSQPG
jgi:dolichol kinase